MTKNYDIKLWLFLFIVAIGITAVQYHNVKRACSSHDPAHGINLQHKLNNFYFYATDKDKYDKEQAYFWKGRVFSIWAASMFVSNRGNIIYNNKIDIESFSNSVASYHAFWVFITLVLLLILSKKKLLNMLIIGVALSYSWLPMAEYQVFPWDGPTLFFWLLILLINETRYKKSILFLIPIASIFKETSGVLCLLILFWDDVPIKQRVVMGVVVGLSVIAVKIGCDIAGGAEKLLGNQSYHYETKCRTGEYWIVHRNINQLFKWNNFNPVYLSLCGMWTGIFLLPMHIKYKLIAGSYLAIIFIPCVITEARLWNELIPVFIVGYGNIIGRKYDTSTTI